MQLFISGPPSGLVLFCSLASVLCRLSSSSAAGGRSGRPPGAWAVGRPTLHGGPVRLRPVRATPCYYKHSAALYYGHVRLSVDRSRACIETTASSIKQTILDGSLGIPVLTTPKRS